MKYITVAEIVYRRLKCGTFLPQNALFVAQNSNLFEHKSTKMLQYSYKSARTLTCLENECYLFHVLMGGQKLVAAVPLR